MVHYEQLIHTYWWSCKNCIALYHVMYLSLYVKKRNHANGEAGANEKLSRIAWCRTGSVETEHLGEPYLKLLRYAIQWDTESVARFSLCLGHTMWEGYISAQKLDLRINSWLAVNVSRNSCCTITRFDRGEMDLSRNSAICSSQSRVNLNVQQHIHICLLHQERYDVYCVQFLVTTRNINWDFAEAR